MADSLDAVLHEHDRILDEKALDVAIGSCTTTPITRMSSDLSATGVDSICQAFSTELHRLRLHAVDVALVSDGGTRGVSYVRVRMPNTEPDVVSRVLSEGERRVVALAGYFAELSMSRDQSAIVLDDPVSSMDQRFRKAVADRLVDEAGCRQVIVFTHDLTFVHDLLNAVDQHDYRTRMRGDASSLQVTERSIIRTSDGTGVVSLEAHHRNPKVKQRLLAIDDEISKASRMYETGDETAYAQAALSLLISLRNAWERAVEELLLGLVVERHSSVVQTSRIRYLLLLPTVISPQSNVE